MNTDTLFQKFRALKVIVIGDVMLDTYLWGSVNRISPEAPVPVVSIEKKDERPGGAANVALNIKSLGATPLLCSVIGKDDAGKSFLKILRKHKISTTGVIASDKRVTTVKSRVLSRNHQMIRFDTETDASLNAADEKNLLQQVKAIIAKEKPQALIFEDYNKGVLTETLIREIIRFCRSKKIFTAVDPKKKNFFTYKEVNLFKPNLRELIEALKLDQLDHDKNSLNTATNELINQLHQQVTLITLSEHGIFFHDGKNGNILPAQKRDIADVSGAGDTVIATATLCLTSGLSLEQSAAIANTAGGLVCEQVGVVPVTKEKLREELALY